jgi:hypothetical protein
VIENINQLDKHAKNRMNEYQQYFSYVVAVSFDLLVEENVVRVEFQ